MYLGWRFRLAYGVAAVVAMAHDAVITIGLFSLLHQEISLTVVAALLTLIGYSMNDTIVVFDRIRENRRARGREPLAETINRSINQTLSRTVLTSGLTLLTALSLLLFGGPVLHGFSLALVIGIIVGTFSSVFIASPILLAWDQRRAERIRSSARGRVHGRCAMNRHADWRKTLLILAIVLASAVAIVRAPVHLGLDLRGGASLILRVKVDDARRERQPRWSSKRARFWNAASTHTAFRRRTCSRTAAAGDELLVQLPGVSDPARITNLLQSRAVLEWYSVEDGPYASVPTPWRGTAASCHSTVRLLPTRPGGGRAAAGLVCGGQPAHHPRHGPARCPRTWRTAGNGPAGDHLHLEPGCGRALRAVHASAHRPALRDRAGPRDPQCPGD